MPHLRRISPALWISLLFVGFGLAFIRKTGLHYDASYEIACFDKCAGPVYSVTLFGYGIPLMVLPYVGALKAWLYQPILAYLQASPFVMRFPLLLVAGGSVWLSFALLDRMAGRRAAIAGALLLATDAPFVLVSTYDFGPVVLLHFCLLAGLLLLLRFDRTGSAVWLGLAFFLFGLALWHKALFIWMLGGLAAGGLVAAPQRIWRACRSPRLLSIATAAFCLGALPLLYYNVATRGGTLRTAGVVSAASSLPQKLLVLRKTLNGTVLYGFVTEGFRAETTRTPAGRVAPFAVAVSGATDSVRSDLLLAAFVLSLLAVPWLWFTPVRRQALFAVVYLAVAWIAMLPLPGTGGSVHHVILLWPFPQFLIAIALSQISWRAGKAVLVVLVGANCVVLNHHYSDLVTSGPAAVWTEATAPLYHYLRGLNRPVIVTDWGYGTTLCLFSDGAIPTGDVSGILQHPAPDELAWLGSLIANPSVVWVNHPAADEMFIGLNQRLADIAAAKGYRSEMLNVIEDANKRPRFQVFQFVPAH